MTELERKLVALGRDLEYPPTPALAAAVRPRLVERPPRAFPWRRALVLALVVLAVAVGAAFAVPQARTTILKWFHLRGVTIERVATLPEARERPLTADLGVPLERAEATNRVGFRILLPRPGPTPQRFYVVGDALVSVVLSVRDGDRSVPVRLSEFRSYNLGFLKKAAISKTRIEHATVNGRGALWLVGAPHVLEFFDRQGRLRQRPVRVSGSVLLWERGQLTLRLEGRISKQAALRVARSVR